MYSITNIDDYLMVKFVDDFDLPMIQTAIRHVTQLSEYADSNDIWHIGGNRADICLGDIDLMVKEFLCCCPSDAKRTKTAIVVTDGLTRAIIQLWAGGLKKRVGFDIQLFSTLDEAKGWLDLQDAEVA